VVLLVFCPLAHHDEARADGGVVTLPTLFLTAGAIGGAMGAVGYVAGCVIFGNTWDWYDFAGNVTAGALTGVATCLVCAFPQSTLVQVFGVANVKGVSNALGPILGDFYKNAVSTISSASVATYKTICNAIESKTTEFNNAFSSTMQSLNDANGGAPTPPSFEGMWADFGSSSIMTSNLSVNTQSMEYNTQTGRSWLMRYPGSSSLTVTFTVSGSIPNGVILALSHLTSADVNATGGGYAPVDIYIKGTLFSDNFDVAQYHSRSHGYEIDRWQIAQRLVVGQNTIRIELEDNPWAETCYWIESLSIMPGVLNGPSIATSSVTPLSGITSDTYAYQALFTDDTGRSPQSAYLYIDGSPSTMSLNSGKPADGSYTYSKVGLSAREHRKKTLSGGSSPVRVPRGTLNTPWRSVL